MTCFTVIAGVLPIIHPTVSKLCLSQISCFKAKVENAIKGNCSWSGFYCFSVIWCQWTLRTTTVLDPWAVLCNVKSAVDVKWFAWANLCSHFIPGTKNNWNSGYFLIGSSGWFEDSVTKTKQTRHFGPSSGCEMDSFLFLNLNSFLPYQCV